MNVQDVLRDLLAEQTALDDVVADLDEAAWTQSTPSPGWTVADQIGHLTYFDGAAAVAITDPDRFRSLVEELFTAARAGADAVDALTLGDYRQMSGAELLTAWRENRRRLADAGAGLADSDRVPWFGPSMGAKSFLTARLMEVWAHGQDVVDAVGGDRPATDRLRHIAQLGFITRGWSYKNRGLDVPDADVRLELRGPAGDLWTWGPDSATDVVRGTAEEFCLVVTQRRVRDDTALDVEGDAARDWISKAQAFAGPPTTTGGHPV